MAGASAHQEAGDPCHTLIQAPFPRAASFHPVFIPNAHGRGVKERKKRGRGEAVGELTVREGKEDGGERNTHGVQAEGKTDRRQSTGWRETTRQYVAWVY